MEFLFELGLFSSKALITVLSFSALFILIFILIIKARQSRAPLVVEDLNQKFDEYRDTLNQSLLDEKALKSELKELKKQRKLEVKNQALSKEQRKRIFVLDFNGDIRASHVENLREEISAILSIAKPLQDEIFVRLESPGGIVHGYGLAASQLLRVKEAGLKLVVSVDKVAASGGYMMACTADHLMSAPFAILGSIGVVAQLPNFHRLLKKNDVDFEEITAGEFKRTVSIFGEITEKGRRKFLDQIEDTHGLFKEFVKEYRPKLDINSVATGEYWYGKRALELALVDEIRSSDDYLFKKAKDHKIYKIELKAKKKWTEKLSESMAETLARVLEKLYTRLSLPQ